MFAAPVSNYRFRAKEVLAMTGGLLDTSVRPPLLDLDDAERDALRSTLVQGRPTRARGRLSRLSHDLDAHRSTAGAVAPRLWKAFTVRPWRGVRVRFAS